MPRKTVAKTVTKEDVQAVVNNVETVASEPKVTLESIPLTNQARADFMTILNVYRVKNPIKFEAKREAFIKKMLSL